MPGKAESPRRIALAGETVPYVLVRARRRSIGLSIDHRGLRVGAPHAATLAQIEALLLQHADWVLDKLRHWQARGDTEPFAIVEGARLPWLGGELTLSLNERGSRHAWSEDGQRLNLALAGRATPVTALQRALRERVRSVLASRLTRFAAVLGVPTPPLALSSARTRWGSCNSRGEIRLNWRLGFFPLHLIDYVVAHELAHLKEMNHSPRFWAVVESLCPDWRQRRVELRQRAANLPIFEE